MGDDRNVLIGGDKVVLVVEDDIRFGKIMIEKAHELGLKAVVATHFGDVFDLVNKYNPIAVTLDVKLTGCKRVESIGPVQERYQLQAYSYTSYIREEIVYPGNAKRRKKLPVEAVKNRSIE